MRIKKIFIQFIIRRKTRISYLKLLPGGAIQLPFDYLLRSVTVENEFAVLSPQLDIW